MQQERNVEATKLAAKHYWRQLKHDWRMSLPALILPGIGNTLGAYVPPLIVAKILVSFSHGARPSFGTLAPYVLWFAAVWLAGEALWRIAMLCLSRAEARGMKNLYIQAMDFLFAKDQSFFNNNFAGSLTKKAIGYGRRYEDIIDTLAFSVVSALIPVVFVLFILWHYSPWLAIALLSMLGITAAVILPLIKRRQKIVAAREAASNVMAGNIADTISGMSVVRAFAREAHEAKQHRANTKFYMDKTLEAWDYNTLRIELLTSPLYVITNTLGLIIALSLSTNGSLNIGAVFVSFSYFAQVTGIMWHFNQIYRNLEGAITDAAQFTELLIEDPVVTDSTKTVQLHTLLQGSIKFDNVTFQHSDSAGKHLFKNLNLEVQKGEKVALVGRSGGGKTTITTLLLRFMNVEGGKILIGGQDIARVKQTDLRSSIAYVPQDPSLFHRSLANNIRYGNLEASDDEVAQAARLAHADEFIKDLPKKYQTMVGERGIKLSGGQRQRIAIARAMIKDAPILVLDEATSALDSESERLIQAALWNLMEDRTAIVIAHRLSTIQKMDRIIVLDEGRIIEEGSHKDLIAGNGVYAKLWAHQSGGFLEE